MTRIRVVEVLVPAGAGRGVPSGGDESQVLGKASGDDYDTEWVDQTGGGGDVAHIAVPIAFDDADLSSPSGAIPGVVIYTPTVGDVLLDAWVSVDPEYTGDQWDGTTPKGDLFTTGNGWWSAHAALGALDMTTGDTAGVLDPELLSGTNALDASESLSQMGARNRYRLVPSKFIDVNPVRAVVSTDGTTAGNDPGATKGTAIVHLLVIPA